MTATNSRSAQRPVFVRVCRSQEVFGVHRSTVYRWAERGWIRIYKRGNVSVVRLADVEAMFENEPENECGTRCGAVG
ncbi:helix-turn-helix domain-containing protein [Profundibacter sp.]